MEGANFLSGKSMRAIWGLKAEAIRERRRVVLLMFWLGEGGAFVETKESSRRDERNWVRFEDMSDRVW